MTGMPPISAPTGVQEWRQGWPLPVVAALGNAVGVSYLYAIGIFVTPLEQAFGWNRSAIPSGLMIVSAMMILFATFGGTLIDRWGARRVALPGVLLYCASLAGLSLAGPSIVSWWLLWVPVGLTTIGVMGAVWVAPVTSRFDRSRGLALATVMCGAGLSSSFIPILAEHYIDMFGWRLAYVALGATLAVVVFPLVWFFFFDATDLDRTRGRREKRDDLKGMDVREAIFSATFIKIVIIALCMITALSALLVHFVPLLESRGITRGTAAAAAGAIGIGSIVGRLTGGMLLDRVAGAVVAVIMFSIPIVVALLLLFSGLSTALIVSISLLLGFALGGEIDIVAYLTSRYFGLKRFGTLFSVICIIQAIGVGVGPVIGGFVYDWTGSYDLLLTGVVPVFALSVILAATLAKYPANVEGAD